MIEVVSPINNDDKTDRLEKLRAALAILGNAMTKGEPKAHEKPKAESVKEPEPAKAE